MQFFGNNVMLENPESHTKKIVQKRISVTNSNCSQILNQFYALDYRGDSRWVRFDKILSANFTRYLSPVDFSSLDFVPYRYTGTACTIRDQAWNVYKL